MKTTKMASYAEAQQYGNEAAFLANVILCQHKNPAKKLAGLVHLLKHGFECKTGQFAIDVLVIDGKRVGWEALEHPSGLAQWFQYS